MSEYTVTYPIHLGQEVWVDTASIDTPTDGTFTWTHKYLKGGIVGLSIKGNSKFNHKSMCVKIDDECMAGQQYFSFSINAMGKTVFDEKPEG